jgi:hypothetical protein
VGPPHGGGNNFSLFDNYVEITGQVSVQITLNADGIYEFRTSKVTADEHRDLRIG